VGIIYSNLCRAGTKWLAVSKDGTQWDLHLDWPPTPGSVPDIIRRNNRLYIYSAVDGSKLIRYHLDTDVVESPMVVSL